jgi:hypothetical protein
VIAAVRLFTDAGGVTHFEDVEIATPQVTPTQLGSETVGATRAMFVEAQPPAGEPVWRPHDARLLALWLAGETTVSASDGEQRRFTTGDVLWCEDLTGAGHCTVHGEGVRMVVVALDPPR